MSREVAALALVAALAAIPSPPASAQQFQTLKAEGPVFILREMGAVLTEKDGAVHVQLLLPASVRPAPCKDAALQADDTILMMNKQRVKTVAELESLYDALETGAELKLGVRRGEDLTLVGCEKADAPAAGGGHAMMIVREEAGPGAGPTGPDGAPGAGMQVRTFDLGSAGGLRPLLGLGVVVAPVEGGEGARVTHRMEGMPSAVSGSDLAPGDVITAIDGTPVKDVESLANAWDAAATGSDVSLTRRRGDDETVLHVTKPEAPRGVTVERK